MYNCFRKPKSDPKKNPLCIKRSKELTGKKIKIKLGPEGAWGNKYIVTNQLENKIGEIVWVSEFDNAPVNVVLEDGTKLNGLFENYYEIVL